MYLKYLKLKTSVYDYHDYMHAQYYKYTTDILLKPIINKVLESFYNEDEDVQNLFLSFTNNYDGVNNNYTVP